VAAVEVDAAVRGNALNVEAVIADAFACGFIGEALSGFEDEDSGALVGEFFGDGAGDRAADLFVAVEEQGYGTV